MKDTMAIFRRIIGYIARIDDTRWVKAEDVAQDMEIDIADDGIEILKAYLEGVAVEVIRQSLEAE